MKFLLLLIILNCNQLFSQTENEYNNLKDYYQKLVSEQEVKRDLEIKNLTTKNYSINKEKIVRKYNSIIDKIIKEGNFKLDRINQEIEINRKIKEKKIAELIEYSQTDKFRLELDILYKYCLWAKKGEFEKKSEWETRINDSSNFAHKNIITNVIQKELKKIKQIYWVKVIGYEVENEVLTIGCGLKQDTFQLKLNKNLALKISHKSKNDYKFPLFYPTQLKIINNKSEFTEGVFLFYFDDIYVCERDYNCSEKVEEKDSIVIYTKTLMQESNHLSGVYDKAVTKNFNFKNVLSEEIDTEKGLYFYKYKNNKVNLTVFNSENINLGDLTLKIEDLKELHYKVDSHSSLLIRKILELNNQNFNNKE